MMIMAERRSPTPEDAPRENFSQGLIQVDIPELGTPIRGKVRDSWVIGESTQRRILVTTDRQSAFDKVICTVPDKGGVLNLLSADGFTKTQNIIANHMIAVPHPNVLIARQAQATLPVEIIMRRYMARSSTTTSIYQNYTDRGRRDIYGINFPEGLRPNEEFPMGTIITPTTKAEAGAHDAELTDEQALETVDSMLGDGIWDKAKTAAYALFERGRVDALKKGLVLVDTKYEFGLDEEGNLMLIDEFHTPDSSRYWLAETYEERFKRGETPDTFDKEILRRWLAGKKFTGDGPIPQVDRDIIQAMSAAYAVPYRMITGQDLPEYSSDPATIRQSVLDYLGR